jgi:membrane protein
MLGYQEYEGPATRFFRALAPTFRYWMQTEVHVYAFSIAANVLLSFFPFLIVSLSLSRLFFDYQTTVTAIDFALHDYFPSVFSQYLHNNLPRTRPIPDVLSILLLLFTANGIFEPLEVALNRAWGIAKNRSFLRNQLVSFMLIFTCGSLALLSLGVAAVNHDSLNGNQFKVWTATLFLRLALAPLSAVILLLVYRFLPNGKPPFKRVVPAAIGVGLLLELLKYVVALVWPWFDAKLAREYGVFRPAVTLIFLSFFASMLVLAGGEWSARGHRFDRVPGAEAIATEERTD